jgi:HlyD family secretion protein
MALTLRRLGPWWLAIVLAAAAVAAVLLWRGRSTQVEVVTLRAAPLVQSVVVAGRVASESRVYLGSTITGRVREVRVREGAKVRAGDLLVQIDDAELASALRQADAALASAQARMSSQTKLAGPLSEQQLMQARANAEAAEREHERSESLFAQGFIGQSRLDEARRAAAVARSQRDAAQAQAQANMQGSEMEQARTRIVEAQAAREVARVRLAQTRVVAPADGTVLLRTAEPGQIVQPGARLVEMSLAGPTQLVAQVDEKFLSQLAPGQTASVAADAFASQRFAARVASIAPGIDALRGSVEVKFALDAVPPFLRNDMTLSIEVVTARRDKALALPPEALRGAASVRVVEDGRAVERAVRIGLRTLEALEVVEGLREGEVVIVGGAVTAGARVRPVERAPRARLGLSAGGGEAMSNAVQSFGR